jgi:hypothetical protein
MSYAMVRTLSAATFAALLSALAPMHAAAQTEDVCANETGAAYGLCTAYCEAMDCDGAEPNANETACGRVHDNFVDRTGYDPPCEVPAVTCPCLDLGPIPGSTFSWSTLVDDPSEIDECQLITVGNRDIVRLKEINESNDPDTTDYITASGDCTNTDGGVLCNDANIASNWVTMCGYWERNGNPPANAELNFSAEEAQACNALLIDAAAANSVTCTQ